MRVLDLAKAFLSALGLTGALIVAGYIIESAYQQLLGTDSRYLGTSAYVGSASEFLLDLGLLFTRVGRVKPALLALLVASVLLVGWFVRRHQDRVRRFALPWRRYFMLLVAAGLLLNIWYYLLPAIKIENILTGNLRQLPEDEPGKAWTRFGIDSGERLWLNTICGHMPDIPSDDSLNKEYNEMVATCTKFVPAEDKEDYQDFYQTKTQAQLAQNVLNVFSWTAFGLIVSIASGHLMLRLMDLETMLAGVLLAVNLLGVPYQYGKSLRLKPVRFATIYLAPDLKSIGDFKTGLILYEDDQGFTFLEAKARKIWFVARSKAVALEVQSIEDVLAYYIAEGIAKAKESR